MQMHLYGVSKFLIFLVSLHLCFVTCNCYYSFPPMYMSIIQRTPAKFWRIILCYNWIYEHMESSKNPVNWRTILHSGSPHGPRTNCTNKNEGGIMVPEYIVWSRRSWCCPGMCTSKRSPVVSRVDWWQMSKAYLLNDQ